MFLVVAACRDENILKFNHELGDLLTRSEITAPKNNVYDVDVLRSINLNINEQKDLQNVADILLFVSHTDPILRANSVTLIRNFIATILKENFEYIQFIQKFTECEDLIEELKLKNVLDILFKVYVLSLKTID